MAGRPKKVRDKATGRAFIFVPGITHGLSGYNNYGCRCDTCRDANSEHQRDYRARKYAGSPLCIINKCDKVQSRAYGNELCAFHNEELKRLRAKKAAEAERRKEARRRKKLAA